MIGEIGTSHGLEIDLSSLLHYPFKSTTMLLDSHSCDWDLEAAAIDAVVWLSVSTRENV
jgi:hypothetical protein